jgi:hypothetical protein
MHRASSGRIDRFGRAGLSNGDCWKGQYRLGTKDNGRGWTVTLCCRATGETCSLQSKFLAGSDEQDLLLEKVQGVESVNLSLDREMLISTELRHSLIREEIRKFENVMVA